MVYRILLLAVLFASSTVLTSAQGLGPAVRLQGATLLGPVVESTSGRVLANLINGPNAGPTPTYFDVKELLRDTIPYASIREFAPFTGTDVNGSGTLDQLTNLGSVMATGLLDAFTGSQEQIDLVEMGVISDGAGPADVQVFDIDGDGLDDYIANFGSEVRISYGDSSSPFAKQSIVKVQEGLTEQPQDRAVQMGMMQGAFCLLKEVFEEIPGETFSYLQLDVYSAEDITNRADTIRRDSTQVKIDGFEVGDGVALQGANHWHWWRASDNQDIHTSFLGIELVDADPTFRNSDGTPFIADGILGQVRRADVAAGMVSLSRQILTVHTALQQGGVYRPVLEMFDVLDEGSMRLQFVRSFVMDTSNQSTIGRISAKIVPDVGGDGMDDVVIGYFAGDALLNPVVDICLSEGVVNSVYGDDAVRKSRVVATSAGWMIHGHRETLMQQAPLYDVQGRQIGMLAVQAGETIELRLQQPRPHGFLWTTVSGQAIRLQ